MKPEDDYSDWEPYRAAFYGYVELICEWPRWFCRLTFHRLGPHITYHDREKP